MSIADRITSMSNNLSNAYDGIEYLGVDTKGVDKNLQNLSSMLNVVYEGLPKVSDEGVSPSIVGSRAGRLNSTLKASDTTQESTTGYNILPITLESGTYNGLQVTKNSDGSITFNGTPTSNLNLAIFSEPVSGLTLNGDYTFYLIGKKAYINLQGNIDGATVAFLTYSSTSEAAVKSYDTNVTLYSIFSYLTTQNTFNNETFYYMVIKGNDKTKPYEPYTGGIPSPNPDYPQDIHVVKGNNTVLVGGIQLFDINDIENGYFTGDAGTANTSTQGFHTTKYIPVGNNTKIYFRFEALDNIQIGRFFVQEYDENFISLKRTSSSVYDTKFTEGQVRKYNITLNEKTKYVRFSTHVIKVLENETYVEKQPAKDYWGTYIKTTVSFTDVDIYKDYEYSSYPINLPEGLELCKIGDYQDKLFKAVSGDTVYDSLTSEQIEGLVSGGWYKYAEVGKLTLNGQENLIVQQATNSPNYTYIYTQTYDSLIKSNLYAGFCNKLTMRNTSTVVGSLITNDILNIGDKDYAKVRCMILSSRLTSADTTGVRKWLSDNLPVAYYILATPTITQITDTTLISQLEALYKAMSKNGQTNVLQTNADNPFIISASALKGG